MSFLVNRIHSFAFIPLPLNENSPPVPQRFRTRRRGGFLKSFNL